MDINNPDDTPRSEPQRPVSQFSLSGMLIWTSVVASIFGVAAVLANLGTNNLPPGRREAVEQFAMLFLMLGSWLLVISVGLPIAVVQRLWIREGHWTNHVRLHPRGIVIGAALGAAVGAAFARFLSAYLPMLVACLQELPHFKSIMSVFGAFVGSIGGAFGGGLPQTRPGLLASLPLSLVAPSLIIAWNWFEIGFLMRAEDYICMHAMFSILASAAVFASGTAWWIRKIAREIAEETTDVSQSADAHDRHQNEDV